MKGAWLVLASAVVVGGTGAQPPATSPSSTSAQQLSEGGIVRGPVAERTLALVFTGHEFAESAPAILDVLARHHAGGAFFLTGAFLRDPAHAAIVRRMVGEGHYVGPHSDQHLLYAPWHGPKTTLVSRGVFEADLERNYAALAAFEVTRQAAPYFLPPYEWYTAEIAQWSKALGMILIRYTPGTRSTADYTGEGTAQFVSSRAIFDSILQRERDDPYGLNGFILLLHVGAGPGRTDKFHRRVGELLDRLAKRGYRFVRVDTLLGPAG